MPQGGTTRSFALALGLIATVTFTGCGGGKQDKPADTSTTAGAGGAAGAVPMQDEYKDIGEALDPQHACSFGGAPPVCSGYISATDMGNTTRLANALGKLSADGSKWGKWSKVIERDEENVPPNSKPKYRVRNLEDARQVAMKHLTEGGLVVAQIQIDKAGSPDKRYKIKGKKGDVFLVVMDSPFDDKKDEVNYGRTFSTYSVYGVKKVNDVWTIDRTINGKPLRYCRMKHSGPPPGLAFFISCENARRFAEISARLFGADSGSVGMLMESLKAHFGERFDDSLTVADFEGALKKILSTQPALAPLVTPAEIRSFAVTLDEVIQDPLSPAWMASGAGCCTADQ